MSEGTVMFLAAIIADGLVSAAAKFTKAVMFGLFSAAKNEAPHPLNDPLGLFRELKN